MIISKQVILDLISELSQYKINLSYFPIVVKRRKEKG